MLPRQGAHADAALQAASTRPASPPQAPPPQQPPGPPSSQQPPIAAPHVHAQSSYSGRKHPQSQAAFHGKSGTGVSSRDASLEGTDLCPPVSQQCGRAAARPPTLPWEPSRTDARPRPPASSVSCSARRLSAALCSRLHAASFFQGLSSITAQPPSLRLCPTIQVCDKLEQTSKLSASHIKGKKTRCVLVLQKLQDANAN